CIPITIEAQNPRNSQRLSGIRLELRFGFGSWKENPNEKSSFFFRCAGGKSSACLLGCRTTVAFAFAGMNSPANLFGMVQLASVRHLDVTDRTSDSDNGDSASVSFHPNSTC